MLLGNPSHPPRRPTLRLSLASALLALTALTGCAGLPVAGDTLNERLLVPSKCTLMGQQTANAACVATREALIGKPLKPGDAEALSCFDRLHESKLNEAKTIFNKAVVKTPTNVHVLSCGEALREIDARK